MYDTITERIEHPFFSSTFCEATELLIPVLYDLETRHSEASLRCTELRHGFWHRKFELNES